MLCQRHLATQSHTAVLNPTLAAVIYLLRYPFTLMLNGVCGECARS